MNELDVEVAGLLGLVIGPTGYDQHSRKLCPYSSDLNACHQFEEGMKYKQLEEMHVHLAEITAKDLNGRGHLHRRHTAHDFLWHATAEQRCRAFVAVMEGTNL